MIYFKRNAKGIQRGNILSRQLILSEINNRKYIELRTYMTFIDPRKQYDKVPKMKQGAR